jgi:hypothetical protein
MARSEVVRRSPQTRGLAVYEPPLAQMMPVLRFGMQLRERRHEFDCWFPHKREMARYADEQRDKLLPLLGKADIAAEILFGAMKQRPDRRTSTAMVGAMLSAFAAKPDPDVLTGMLDMLEGGEEIAGMLGMLGGTAAEPPVTTAGLALACRGLIASATFTPKPTELRAACHKAECHLKWARETTDKLVDFVRRCDALLLEFDHEQWERPYLTPELRPVLERMLELHMIYGDGSMAWDEANLDDENHRIHPFAALVRAEWAKLPPEDPEPMRLAACEAKPAKRTKRTRKPKREG